MIRSRFLRVAAIVVGVVALLGPALHAQDAGALAFLRSVYATYEKTDKALDIASEAKAARYFVPVVARLIAKDIAESKRRNEVGRLDFDPFIGGQDWEPMKIDLAIAPGASAVRATGTARFTAPGEKKPTVVTLDLLKTAAGWRIADIRWSEQADSLVAVLDKKTEAVRAHATHSVT